MPTNLPDHYRTLGVEPRATTADIRQAYHIHAKAAHPDAGGSTARMAAVNEAYRVLSDPDQRAEYDRECARAAAIAAARSQAPHYGIHTPTTQEQHLTHLTHAAMIRAKHEAHERMRRQVARQLAWDLMRPSAVLALLVGILVRFFTTQTTDTTYKYWLILISFVPVYSLIIGTTFLVYPTLRLDIHDVSHGYRHPTPAAFIPFIALVVAAPILAAIWFWLSLK